MIRRVAVIGLGYVGLPVAAAFANAGHRVIGFDISQQRIAELRRGEDRTREVGPAELKSSNLVLTADVQDLSQADFYIVTVPTPIDEARRPDLRPVFEASRMVGSVLKRGDIVVYESTVYPGATEEKCVPILEEISKLKAGQDFAVGYSPERVNPGDQQRRFETIQKIVAGQDARTLEIVADVYGSVVTAGVYRAPSIKVAEAAKGIENAQRDLNIAFMNEVSAICHHLGIDTMDVIEAASTKWNFLRFTPGLVGGHCIGIDPYYLTHRAEVAGYYPEIILAGRRINDGVALRVARECVRHLLRSERTGTTVTVLGLTFKENVPDIRNSKVIDIIRELKSFGLDVRVHDALANPHEAQSEYQITLTPLEDLGQADAVILAVPHESYRSAGWPLLQGLLRDGRGHVFDVKSSLDRTQRPEGVELWRL